MAEAEHRQPTPFNLNNFLGESRNYTGQEKKAEVTDVLTEGWMWLETERMLVPRGGDREWFNISRRGRALLAEGNLEAYLRGNLLREMTLDPALARKVRPTYLRGDYETAVFQAFKEVEVAVRQAGRYSETLVGVPLMRQAFDADNGQLTNTNATRPEREALAHLFAGAFGSYKNPSSHRHVSIGADEAVEMIMLASHLLKIVDSRSSQGPN